MQRKIYGRAINVEIRPLNEERAVQAAADLIGEAFLFSVPASFMLSSSDELPVSVLAEVVCLAALESIEIHFRDKSLGRGSASFFKFFRKPERISLKDMSVCHHSRVGRRRACEECPKSSGKMQL